MMRKRLINDLPTVVDYQLNAVNNKLRKNNENILKRLTNRESTGYFNNNLQHKSNLNAFEKIPEDLQFCLKEIIPYCYLNQVYMGLSSCGQFLLSYCRIVGDNENESYDFNGAEYKYELFFWIYRPHHPLTKYFNVNLFDDHGVDEIKNVSITQWSSDPQTLIIHGSSEIDDQHSFISFMKIPKLGCLDCKQIREHETMEGNFNRYDLCVKCNLTIHTKYRYNESAQKFNPKIHLNSPDYIIMSENSLIHTINVELDMQKVKNYGSNTLSHTYFTQDLSAGCDKNTAKSSAGYKSARDNYSAMKVPAPVAETTKCDNNPKLSLVEQILADFSDYDEVTECNSGVATTSATKHVYFNNSTDGCDNVNDNIEELIITCNAIQKTPKRSPNKTDCAGTSSGRQIVPSNSPESSCKLQEAAANTYEFSEDNEKCEKISIFRKRRLADKKYEFNEDNTENIIPFNRTRSRSNLNPWMGASNYMPPHSHRASPNHGFRSPCGSPVSNRVNNPPGFRSPSYYSYKSPSSNNLLSSPPPRQITRNTNPTVSPVSSFSAPNDEVHKYFSDILNRIKEHRTEIPPIDTAIIDVDSKLKAEEIPIFSKMIVNHYVEEDDANSVVTNEEDDCISPGYHTSLPMEVHGSCYSKMQIIPKSSLERLRGVPRVKITQNSFDVETFSIHIANTLGKKNNKKYGILFDLSYEIVYVCPLSQNISVILMLQFTASDFDKLSQCYNCSNDSDCFTHRKLYESTVLFTWNMRNGDWTVLNYGKMKLITVAVKRKTKNQELLIKKLQKLTRKTFAHKGESFQPMCDNDYFQHLRILDSNEDKTKETLVDYKNAIEFYRRQPYDTPSSNSSMSSSQSISSVSSESESMDEDA